MQQDTQDRILDALRRKAFEEALAAARDAVDDASDDPQAHRLLAMALRGSGDGDAARASIERAIALSPDDADLHFERAGYLLGARQVAGAQAALAQTVALDPNQFGAYVLQGQLALARGDLDEAEHMARLAARIEPEHPAMTALEGTIALRRGDATAALAMLSRAAEQAPDDMQIQFSLGFAHLAGGHFAFAEQCFRRVLESSPGAITMRALIAQLLQRQGQHAEAADELAPLLADGALATPALFRYAGELELVAGRQERALSLLRRALSGKPDDRRALTGLMEIWGRTGDAADARGTLDAALATSPDIDVLWQARLEVERADGAACMRVLERWRRAQPEALLPLEAQMALLASQGSQQGADAVAREIITRAPGHAAAERVLIEAKLRQDPAEAVEHIGDLITHAHGDDNRRMLQSWLAMANDRAGRPAEAVAIWSALATELADQQWPVPEPATPPARWPSLAEAPDRGDGLPVAGFLFGAPGSMVERVATVLSASLLAFRADRFSEHEPDDALQSFSTPRRLVAGELDAQAVADSWRAQLPARGISDGEVIDWLLWWDNALLLALRPCLPQAMVLFAIRDPRDMLIDWLAYGSTAPFRVTTPTAAAGALTIVLNQIASLHEQDLFPHRLLRLDGITDDAARIAKALGDALQAPLAAPSNDILGPPHFEAGHWRAYAGPLAEAFAMLTPVARRLGYPED
jgi:tetratricopeptide (TPR) repeat protein